MSAPIAVSGSSLVQFALHPAQEANRRRDPLTERSVTPFVICEW